MLEKNRILQSTDLIAMNMSRSLISHALMIFCVLWICGCNDGESEQPFQSASNNLDEPASAELPTLQEGGNAGELPELNFEKSSELAPSNPASSTGNVAPPPRDKPSANSSSSLDSLMEDLIRLNSANEYTPQGQYNLSGKLLDDYLRLSSQNATPQSELDDLLQKSSEWMKKSAMQGYLPAMLMIQGKQQTLGRKEILIWQLIKLHADNLTAITKTKSGTIDNKKAYVGVVKMNISSLDQGELTAAVEEAEKRISKFTVEGYMPSAKSKVCGDFDLTLWKRIKKNCIDYGELNSAKAAAFQDENDNGAPTPIVIAVVRKFPVEGHSVGETIEFVYVACNIGESPISIPEVNFGESKRNTLGTLQCWVERLGSDPEIPSMPAMVARNGNKYAAGGSPVICRNSVLEPDGTTMTLRKINTSGYPSGQYRFYLNLSSKSEIIKSQNAVVDFSLK